MMIASIYKVVHAVENFERHHRRSYRQNNEETKKMNARSINAAQKKEQVALKELTSPRRDPALVDEDLDGWGDAWLGLLEEEDTLFSMQDWEGKKRKMIR
jgi:uncharacterized membrane protein